MMFTLKIGANIKKNCEIFDIFKIKMYLCAQE